jgi:uncharacterized protein
MHRPKIFVNLPVKDLNKSVEFFTKLGYSFNPQFTDENASCMIIGEEIYSMLLVEPFFKTFTKRELADTSKTVEVAIALSTESRQAVDAMVNKALAAGATPSGEPKDHGFMYEWGFEDLDGHSWSYFWMDPAMVQQQQ